MFRFNRVPFFGPFAPALVLLFASLPVEGQTFLNPQDCQVWDGPRLVTLLRDTAMSPIAQVQEPNGSISLRIPPPIRREGWSAGQLHYGGGRFFYSRFRKGVVGTQEGRYFEHEVLVWDNKDWVSHASARFPGLLTGLFPLDDDRFLATATVQGVLQKDGRSYPFATLRLNAKGELQLVELQDTGLEKPFFTAQGRPAYGSLSMSFLMGNWARTEGYLLLFSQFGHFWIFDEDKGHLKRMVCLYKGLSDQRLQEGNLFSGILGVQPRPSGHLLVAAKREDAVLFAPLAFPQNQISPGVAGQQVWADSVQKHYPHVEWWDLDPETGTFTPEAAPQGFPELFLNQADLNNFNWRFKPDGNLSLLTQRERHPIRHSNSSELSSDEKVPVPGRGTSKSMGGAPKPVVSPTPPSKTVI